MSETMQIEYTEAGDEQKIQECNLMLTSERHFRVIHDTSDVDSGETSTEHKRFDRVKGRLLQVKFKTGSGITHSGESMLVKEVFSQNKTLKPQLATAETVDGDYKTVNLRSVRSIKPAKYCRGCGVIESDVETMMGLCDSCIDSDKVSV